MSRDQWFKARSHLTIRKDRLSLTFTEFECPFTPEIG